MKNKYREKTCVDCGRKFMPTSGRQMRCPFCIGEKKSTGIGICKCCGKKFKKIKNNHEFCGKDCRLQFNSFCQNSYTENVFISENERLASPTTEYIKKIDFLLKDFGICVEIPDFQTVKDLEEWKSKMIQKYL